MAAPNLLTPTTVTGKTATQALGTSATAIVSNAAGSGKLLRIVSLIVANVDGTNPADVTVDHYRSSTARHIAKAVTVAAKQSLTIIDRENAIYLEEGDDLRLTASATNDLEAICSYEDVS